MARLGGQRQREMQGDFKSHLPSRGELGTPVLTPSLLSSLMNLSCNCTSTTRRYAGTISKHPKCCTRKSPTVIWEACALACPCLAGCQNFLIENTFGFGSWICGRKTNSCGLNSLPCRSVDAVLFILVSRRYHSVQRNTCCPHCQLSFPSWRQEVKNWKSLKLLARAFVISRLIHCLRRVCETRCTNCQECPGMSAVLFPVLPWCWSAQSQELLTATLLSGSSWICRETGEEVETCSWVWFTITKACWAS